MAKEALSYAVRPRVIGLYVGQLAFLVGCLSLPPGVFALVEKEWLHAVGYFVVSGALATCGYTLRQLHVGDDVQQNEAFVIVTAIFILTPLALSLPLNMSGIPFIDALFQAISGITTTGLSTLSSIEGQPRSVIFTSAWLQWLGGIGFMVLTFALLFGQGASARRLTGVISKQYGVIGGTRSYALIIIRIYSALTLFGIAVLWLAGTDLFAATTLTLSGVSTGGFSPSDKSLGGFSVGVQALIILLSVASAVALPLYHEAWRGNWKVLFRDPELHTLLIVGLLVSILLVLPRLLTGEGQAMQLAMTAFSAQSTAGFAVMPVNELDSYSKALLIVSMLIGGSVGSSAGGIKLLRLIALIGLVLLMIRKTRLSPHAVQTSTIAGREWRGDELLFIFVVVCLVAGVVALSWLTFLWYGYAPLDALFEVASATGTVGLSSGITRPTLEPILKVVLCIDMLLGRLEIFPVLVMLAPRTWIGQRRQPSSKLEG